MVRKATAKPAVKAVADTSAKVLKKPDILDEVVTRTQLKKREVKPAIEVAMTVIGDALRDGTEVNLPPLGKIRVVKSKALVDGAAVLTLKLRLPKNAAVAAKATTED